MKINNSPAKANHATDPVSRLSPTTPAPTCGWFKAIRSNDAMELIQKNPNAYIIAAVIAARARWHEGFNADGLYPGEALIGDHAKCGLTRQQYRTAKKHLQANQFATFKTTNKGTIGKLTDTRLFDVLNLPVQPSKQPTPNQQNNPKSVPTRDFSTIKTTTKGTEAKPTDTRLSSVSGETANHQNNQRLTTQATTQATTNYKDNKERKKELGGTPPAEGGAAAAALEPTAQLKPRPFSDYTESEIQDAGKRLGQHLRAAIQV